MLGLDGPLAAGMILLELEKGTPPKLWRVDIVGSREARLQSIGCPADPVKVVALDGSPPNVLKWPRVSGEWLADAAADRLAQGVIDAERGGFPIGEIPVVPPQEAPPGTICPECGGTQDSPKLVRLGEEEPSEPPTHRCPHPWHSAKLTAPHTPSPHTKVYGRLSVGDAVEIEGHHEHKLPPILEARPLPIPGRIVEFVPDTFLVWVEIDDDEGDGEPLGKVRLHRDQIEQAKN